MLCRRRNLTWLINLYITMPRKNVRQKDAPELFAKVFKIINGLKDKRSYITVYRVAKEIHAKLEHMGLKPHSRNVLVQVRRALKYGVENNLFTYKSGKYRLANKATAKSLKKSIVPLDSLELLKARKSKKRAKNSDIKKHRRSSEEVKCSCRKRHNKCCTKPNKRYLSRKCKSRYYTQSSNEKSSKASSKSNRHQTVGGSAGETTNAENTKSGSAERQQTSRPQSDIHHWKNKEEAVSKSKFGKQSRKSRMHLSSCIGSHTNSGGLSKSRNRKRKVKNLKVIENLSSSDNALSGLSTSTAIAAAIMIMMSLWYGYR